MGQSPIFRHHYESSRLGENGYLSDVSSQQSVVVMKRRTYFYSVTQRERSYFRQLNFCSVRLECSQALHYMLTNHFFVLSKPGHPHTVCTAKIVKSPEH